MNEDKINELLDNLFNKTITKTYSSSSDSYEVKIIEEEGRAIVEQIIRQYLNENREERIGVLEAKVYAYEKMIANSNFAPILENDKEAN